MKHSNLTPRYQLDNEYDDDGLGTVIVSVCAIIVLLICGLGWALRYF
jgi:hypothetical protein